MIKIKYLSKAPGRYYISLKDHNKLMRKQEKKIYKEVYTRHQCCKELLKQIFKDLKQTTLNKHTIDLLKKKYSQREKKVKK